MPHLEHTVTVNRPVQDVFAFVANPENETRWRSSVADIERGSGDGGVGTVYKQGVKGPLGRRMDADCQVVALEPNALVEFQGIAGDLKPRVRWVFEPEGEATRLTFNLDYDDSNMNRIQAKFVGKAMSSDVKAIDKLRQLLES